MIGPAQAADGDTQRAAVPDEARRSEVPAWGWASLAALTLLALAIRLLSLRQSLWGDEGFTWLVTGHSTFGGMIDAVRSDYEVTPPFYFALAWLSRRLGDSPEAIRTPSVLAATLLVPAIFALGRRTVGWRAGLLGGALVALSPMAIYYGVEARNYSLLALEVTLSTLVLLKATSKYASRWWWVAFSLLTALALYTHYTSVFVIAAQFLWVFLFRRDGYLCLLGSGLAAAVLFAPWLPELARDSRAAGSQVIAVLSPLTSRAFGRGIAAWLFGLPEASLKVVPGPVALGLLAVLALVVTGYAASRLLSRRPAAPGSKPALVALVAIAAPLGVLLVSMVGDDIFLPRNLMSSLPCALLLVSAGVLALPGRTRTVGAVVLVIAYGIAAASTFRAAASRPDLRSVAQLLDAKAPADALVADYMSTVLGGGDQLNYVEFQSGRPHSFVYYSPTTLDGSPGFEVVMSKPGRGRAVRSVEASNLLDAATIAAAGRGKPELFVAVPDLPVFGRREAIRKVPGYSFEGRTTFPGSIPMIVDRYKPVG